MPAEETMCLIYYGAPTPLGTTDMSGRTTLSVDGGEPVPLVDLLDTSAGRRLAAGPGAASPSPQAGQRDAAGERAGGGLTLDAFALCDDLQWKPSGTDVVESRPESTWSSSRPSDSPPRTARS